MALAPRPGQGNNTHTHFKSRSEAERNIEIVVPLTKENGKKEKRVAQVCLYGTLETNTRENTETENPTDGVRPNQYVHCSENRAF